MPPETFQIPIDADPAGVTAVAYPANDGRRLPALLVLAHGAGAGQRHPFMTAYAAQLAERGIDVVTFNFPYMERRRRMPDRAPVLEQAFRQVVAAAARRPEARGCRLFVGGKSMGGRMATHLAAAPSAWPTDAPPLAGVVVFGYPLVPPGGRRKGDRVTHLRQLGVPTLIVQGTRDPFGGPDEVRAAIFADDARPPVDIVGVSGADHSFGVLRAGGRDPESVHAEVQDAVVRWMQPLAGG
ncbi:MAG: alpha/beta fold hydrolase [Vicinamibacterales bacterium]